jgi:excisionase family DNA binding protein
METQPLLNVDDVSRLLPVNRVTVYKWAREGVLPRLKAGGRVLFDPAEVMECLRRERQAKE